MRQTDLTSINRQLLCHLASKSDLMKIKNCLQPFIKRKVAKLQALQSNSMGNKKILMAIARLVKLLASNSRALKLKLNKPILQVTYKKETTSWTSTRIKLTREHSIWRLKVQMINPLHLKFSKDAINCWRGMLINKVHSLAPLMRRLIISLVATTFLVTSKKVLSFCC